MPDIPSGNEAEVANNHCLNISLESVASHMRTSDGKEIPFARAMLTLRNICHAEVLSVMLHANIGQEGGTVQDVTGVFPRAAVSSIPPGGTVSWDVYDQLLPAHPGTASKVHMFGYRAALNWRFDLAAYVEYRHPDSSQTLQTPVSRWTFRWSVINASTGEVGLTIDTSSVE